MPDICKIQYLHQWSTHWLRDLFATETDAAVIQILISVLVSKWAPFTLSINSLSSFICQYLSDKICHLHLIAWYDLLGNMSSSFFIINGFVLKIINEEMTRWVMKYDLWCRNNLMLMNESNITYKVPYCCWRFSISLSSSGVQRRLPPILSMGLLGILMKFGIVNRSHRRQKGSEVRSPNWFNELKMNYQSS